MQAGYDITFEYTMPGKWISGKKMPDNIIVFAKI